LIVNAEQVKEVLKLEAKKARVRQQGKAAGVDVSAVIAEIDVEIAKVKEFASKQLSLKK